MVLAAAVRLLYIISFAQALWAISIPLATQQQARRGTELWSAQQRVSDVEEEEAMVVGQHPIDYSAANEFITEHYPFLYPSSYFTRGSDLPFDEENHASHPSETIHNARWGVDRTKGKGPTLEEHGFALFHLPTKVEDFSSLLQIRARYLPELECLINDHIFAKDDILHLILWNPMLRGENQTVSRSSSHADGPSQSPTSPTAGMVHIDQDVGAHSTESILSLVFNNALLPVETSEREAIRQCVEKGHRFAIVNFWRNADFRHPVRRQPLAVLHTKYNSGENAPYFPEAQPDGDNYKWYMFPEMTADEVLVFKQYDRDGAQPSDVWHCALKSFGGALDPERQSFDVRAFVVFSNVLSSVDQDRFRPTRVRPVLDWETSCKFCHQQSIERNTGNTSET